MTEDDELMQDLGEIYEAAFQFDDEEPIGFAFVVGGEFSLTLSAENTLVPGNEPTVIFSDGKGKSFKLLLRKS